jgi:hypothetical protein
MSSTQKEPGRKNSDPTVATMWLHLKAPVEFFERIDRWCAQQQAAQRMIIRPTRPAAIRYIVHNFLERQERKKPRPRRGKK